MARRYSQAQLITAPAAASYRATGQEVEPSQPVAQ